MITPNQGACAVEATKLAVFSPAGREMTREECNELAQRKLHKPIIQGNVFLEEEFGVGCQTFYVLTEPRTIQHYVVIAINCRQVFLVRDRPRPIDEPYDPDIAWREYTVLKDEMTPKMEQLITWLTIEYGVNA